MMVKHAGIGESKNFQDVATNRQLATFLLFGCATAGNFAFFFQLFFVLKLFYLLFYDLLFRMGDSSAENSKEEPSNLCPRSFSSQKKSVASLISQHFRLFAKYMNPFKISGYFQFIIIINNLSFFTRNMDGFSISFSGSLQIRKLKGYVEPGFSSLNYVKQLQTIRLNLQNRKNVTWRIFVGWNLRSTRFVVIQLPHFVSNLECLSI